MEHSATLIGIWQAASSSQTDPEQAVRQAVQSALRRRRLDLGLSLEEAAELSRGGGGRRLTSSGLAALEASDAHTLSLIKVAQLLSLYGLRSVDELLALPSELEPAPGLEFGDEEARVAVLKQIYGAMFTDGHPKSQAFERELLLDGWEELIRQLDFPLFGGQTKGTVRVSIDQVGEMFWIWNRHPSPLDHARILLLSYMWRAGVSRVAGGRLRRSGTFEHPEKLDHALGALVADFVESGPVIALERFKKQGLGRRNERGRLEIRGLSLEALTTFLWLEACFMSYPNVEKSDNPPFDPTVEETMNFIGLPRPRVRPSFARRYEKYLEGIAYVAGALRCDSTVAFDVIRRTTAVEIEETLARYRVEQERNPFEGIDIREDETTDRDPSNPWNKVFPKGPKSHEGGNLHH